MLDSPRAVAVADSVESGALVAGGFHIETYTGAYLDLPAPAPADVRLADVAHGLAHICRGAGQPARFTVSPSTR